MKKSILTFLCAVSAFLMYATPPVYYWEAKTNQYAYRNQNISIITADNTCRLSYGVCPRCAGCDDTGARSLQAFANG